MELDYETLIQLQKDLAKNYWRWEDYSERLAQGLGLEAITVKEQIQRALSINYRKADALRGDVLWQADPDCSGVRLAREALLRFDMKWNKLVPFEHHQKNPEPFISVEIYARSNSDQWRMVFEKKHGGPSVHVYRGGL